MESVSNLEACRICANFYVTSSDVDFVNLFESSETLQQELNFIEEELRGWHLNISCNDGLPQRICGNCFTKFCSIYAFREECHEAQQKLLQAFVEGDCVEEVVTAQESTPPQGNDEELIIGTLDGVREETVPMTTEHDYQEPQQEQQPYDEVHKVEIKQQVDIKPTLSADEMAVQSLEISEQQVLEDEHVSKVETIQSNEDLEQVLRGNFIVKSIDDECSNNSSQNNSVDYEQTTTTTTGNDNGYTSSLEDNDTASQTPLACQYCYYVTTQRPLSFRTDEELSQHFFDAHDPTYPYTCPQCPQKFSNGRQRLQHVKEQHVSNSSTCRFCCVQLMGLTQREHMNKCTFLGDWTCSKCSVELNGVTYAEYQAHYQRNHTKKLHNCDLCGRVFANRIMWENHQSMHKRNTSIFWCNECKEAFPDSYELKKHKYKEHSGALPVSCDYCDKSFVTYAFLNRHMLHFHPDKLENAAASTSISCNNCGLDFTSLHKLRYHQQKQRDENGKCIPPPTKDRKPVTSPLYPCPYCSKRYYVKLQLERHITSHDVSKRPYRCDRCHVMCRSPAELKQHQSVAHVQSKPFVCQECGKKFNYKKDLRDHMLYHQELHTPCPEEGCGYICKNDKMLNEHIRQKHRLMPCEFCSETFTHKRLAAHLRTAHKEEMAMEDELQDFKSEIAEKVVVEFVTDGVSNEIVLNEQPDHEFAGNSSNYEDYAMEQIIELEHEIDVI